MESIINANIAEPTDVDIANKDPTTPAKFQFQCDICEFKCKWNKSFQMHMLKKHSKIESSEDSTEVTTAINDATTPTPDPPINPTTKPTINTTTTEETALICHHFQREACNFGECCWKKT